MVGSPFLPEEDIPYALFTALQAYILSAFMTISHFIRPLTAGLISHVEKISLALRE